MFKLTFDSLNGMVNFTLGGVEDIVRKEQILFYLLLANIKVNSFLFLLQVNDIDKLIIFHYNLQLLLRLFNYAQINFSKQVLVYLVNIPIYISLNILLLEGTLYLLDLMVKVISSFRPILIDFQRHAWKKLYFGSSLLEELFSILISCSSLMPSRVVIAEPSSASSIVIINPLLIVFVKHYVAY